VGVSPRDEITGDVLGDPVNGDVADRYHFNVHDVELVYESSVLRVRL